VSYAPTSGVTVGTKATQDPILAQASLEAALLVRQAVERPKADRLAFIERKMRAYGPEGRQRFSETLRRLDAKTRNHDQALFDAVRLTAADHLAREAVSLFRADAARTVGAEALGGGINLRRLGCGITGMTTAIGGAVAAGYTGGAGGTAVTTGGALVGSAMDCDKAAREAAKTIAEQQAMTAQAQLEAARVAAEAQERAAKAAGEERTKQVRTAVFVGGGLLLLLGAGYAIVRV